ncbi:MAG: hypothetical protein J0M28_13975 [Thauera sp.]|nr:hypothetical protein [Thauera sp.]
MNAPAVAGVDFARLAVQYRERAQKCEHTAKVYLRIIIGVLSACILIFAGADRLAGALFKTAAEREAEALLSHATTQILRNLSAASEQMRNSTAAQGEAPQPDASKPDASKPDASKPSLPVPPPANGAVLRPPAAPFAAAAGPAPPAPVAAGPAAPAAKPVRPPVERTPSTSEALRRTVKQLYEDNAALQQQLAQARDRLGEEGDRLAVEEVRKDTAVEVAQIRASADETRAWADRDVAQTRADAERDVAQAKADAERAVAEEGTRRAEDLNALIASSVARVGSAVIVVLLVRIFLRDRQRLILLAGFYAGLADALEISAGDPARLREWLPQLVPPAMATADDVATPIETVMQAVVELAKRSRT